MWKKKEEKKEAEKAAEKEVDLLAELCRDDTKLHDFLSSYLFVDPLSAVSKKSLDILTEEGLKSGDFRPAVDKAIFEGSQNLGEKARYIKIIQNLGLKTIHAMEQEKAKATKEGLSDRVALLGKRIENQKFMSERTEDILNAASKFYAERLVILGESERREERRKSREKAEAEEWRKAEIEKEQQEERKKERRGMGREERREAEKQEKIDELAGKERKEAIGEARGEAQREEQRIEEIEKKEREARQKEREGN